MPGRIILSHYEQEKSLDESCRDDLADIILNEFLKDDYNRKISYDCEVTIADKILELFPSESKDIWVSPVSHKRSSSIGRGKLLTCYYSKRRKLNANNLISKESTGENDNPDDVLDENEDNDALLWLMNNAQPWSDVTERWKETSELRMRRLIGGAQSVGNYMKKYPALLDNTGFLLLEIDFETHFKVNGLTLYAEWPKLTAFIESRLPKTV